MSLSDPRAPTKFFYPKRTAHNSGDAHVNQESQHLIEQEQLQQAQTTRGAPASLGSGTAHSGSGSSGYASTGDTSEGSGSAGSGSSIYLSGGSGSAGSGSAGYVSAGYVSAGSGRVGSGGGGAALVEIERIWRIRNKGKDLPATTGNWEFISFAEDYWTKKAKVSAGRLDAYRTNLASSTNQLLQLIGLFIVFQGVLLTACVQSARLTCKTYWFPLTLDIIATLCAIFGVWFKFKEIIVFEELEDEFNQEHKHTVSQLAELKDEPEKYDFQKPDPDLPARRYELIIPILVEVAICGFASVAMYLMHRVMCR